MRAMIVAAGLGTRLQPLTHLRPKPSVPVQGLPLIAYALGWLHAHAVTEVMINVHHLPEVLEETARRHCPPGMQLSFSIETTLLDTGGGIRRVVDFLRASDPCLLIGGDMVADADLGSLVARHRERGDAITMLLRDDPRIDSFGSIGIDAEGRVRRIASRLDLGGETRAGLYTWVNVVSARAFDHLPDLEVFSHFAGWIAPMLAAGARDIRGEMDLPNLWIPVGTPEEYLRANFEPLPLSYRDEIETGGLEPEIRENLVIGAGATLAAGASLRRVVVWDGESVPADLRAADGVFAGGRFHPMGQNAPVIDCSTESPQNGARSPRE
jgi:NDP-sugar pyrophosphorylase family protein